MSLKQFLPKELWACADNVGFLYERDFDRLRDPLCGQVYVRTEEYIRVNFTKPMDECLNAEDKRKHREKIIMH